MPHETFNAAKTGVIVKAHVGGYFDLPLKRELFLRALGQVVNPKPDGPKKLFCIGEPAGFVLRKDAILDQIRRAVGDDFTLFYDTGIRSGEDVAKAYAMGADFVFLGRILQFALAANGEAGLNQLWSVMTEEFDLALAQMGQTSPAGLKYAMVGQE